jgi:hypothetical protein
LNAIDPLHAANKVLCLGDRFEFGLDNSNRDRRWTWLLRERWEREAQR